jgi:hypothetical protein
MTVAIQRFADNDNKTIVDDYARFVHIVSHWMNHIARSVFLVTILRLDGVFYQYRYVKEQLTALLATLFDY